MLPEASAVIVLFKPLFTDALTDTFGTVRLSILGESPGLLSTTTKCLDSKVRVDTRAQCSPQSGQMSIANVAKSARLAQ